MWPKEEYDTAFKNIKSCSLLGGSTALILVNATTDSVCACRILTQLMQQEQIPYKIKAVGSNDDLKAVSQSDIVTDDELQTVVLINCGAMIDLAEDFPLGETTVCYVIDSRRPVHLSNIGDSDRRYIVFSDTLLNEDEIPSDIDDTRFLREGERPVLDEHGSVLKDRNGNDVVEAFFYYLDGQGNVVEEGTERLADRSRKRGGYFDDSSDEEDFEMPEQRFQANSEAVTPGGVAPGQQPSKRQKTTGGISNFFSSTRDGSSASEQQSPTVTGALPPVSQAGESDGDAENLRATNPQGDENNDVDAGARGDDESGDDDDEETAARPDGAGSLALAVASTPEFNAKRNINRRDYTRMKIDEQRQYYVGSYYGMPSACVMYELARQLNRDTNDLLWMALVGLTDHYVHDLIDHDTYAHLAQEYRQEVVGKNSEGSRFTQNAEGENIPVSEAGKISFTEEYRFMLHRHWSLYDAMYYSRFVSSRLNIWKMGGREQLKTFMAKMGVSLKEAQQNFCYMSMELKSRLRDKIDEYAEEYNLKDIVYGSFTRLFGFGHVFSAADYAFAIMAELECGGGSNAEMLDAKQPMRLTLPQGGGVDRTTTELQLQDFRSKLSVFETKQTERRFNAAYGIVSNENVDTLVHCMKASMEVQRAVIRQGIAVIEQKKLVNAGKFRYTYVENMSDGDIQYFQRPALLTKLGLWLVEAAREAGKRQGRGKLPIVLCVLNEMRGNYQCVGVTCPEEFGALEKNSFGNAFKKAAEQVKVRYNASTFEASSVEVKKDDIVRFIESLYLVMEELDE